MSTGPNLSSICYKRNFLTEVVARVDLVSPLPGLMNELPKNISKVALESFPIDEPKPAFTQELLFTEKELATRKQEFTEWNFHGRNREKTLTIVPQSFFVVYKSYEKYENLRNEFISIVESFFSCFEQAQPSRIGLRYVNQLDVQGPNPLDWHDYVSQELLGLFSYTIDGAVPSRVFHNFETVFSDFSLRFQFGVHNPDYPAPIRRRAFILDYDAYFQGLLEPKDIPERLDKYHSAIQKVFEQNITEKLREVMNASA
jgi:uncharacterized protein (TIGR04255 family)